jgi:hypothetical protein
MINIVSLFAAVAAASALGIGALAHATPENTLEIVIGGGPNAGTYRLPAADISCIHFKQRKNLFAVYKDFDARDPKKIGEAGIDISNPDEAGTKRGSVLVHFGARDDKRGMKYNVSIPDQSTGPLTVIRNGKNADLAFQGRTKEGISIRVTAKCQDVEELDADLN